MRPISHSQMRNALLLSLTLTIVHSLKPSQYGSGSPNMNPPTSRAYNINNNNNNNNNDNYNNNNSNNNNNDNNYNDNSNQNPGGDVGYVPTTSYQEDNSFDQESVEERLASWREQQQVSIINLSIYQHINLSAHRTKNMHLFHKHYYYDTIHTIDTNTQFTPYT